MHRIKNYNGTTLTYPQLLFSIPYTSIKVDPTKLFVIYDVYDSSGQYDDFDINPNEILVSEKKTKLIRDYLAPSKNFYRLNFLDFNNSEFDTTDLLRQSLEIECPATEHKKYCFEDNNAYICKNGYNLITDSYMENLLVTDNPSDTENSNIEQLVTTTSCVEDCIITKDGVDHKYMRLPNIKVNQKTRNKIDNNLCSYECNSTFVEDCPSEHTNNLMNFKCNNSFYSYFFQCLDIEQYPAKDSALQFSGTLNTKSIYFPFNQDLYCFYIEIWFHTELLTQEEPPLEDKFLFLTNNHQIYYDVLKGAFMLKVYNTDNTPSTFNLNQKIYYYGWNHLIIYTREEVTKGSIYTTFTVSLTNNLINVGNIKGRSTANKICFCNEDNNCCDRVSKARWFDVFVKEIKVWDARYTNYYTLNDYDKYNYIVPGGLLQMYNLTSASLDHNIIVDLRHPNNSDYNAQFPFDVYEFNPDDDMNYNIGWNFNWNDLNYPKFIISTKLLTELTRVQIFQTGDCFEGCLKCFGPSKHSCFSCQPGYALIGATCTKTYNDDLSIYYYVNPLKQGDGLDSSKELELNFLSLNLNAYATITLFFYIKIYGFTQAQIDEYEHNQQNLFKLITLSETNHFYLY